MQRNKKNHRDISDVVISEDRVKVTYKDKGEDHEVTLEGLQLWMVKQSFNPDAFQISGQHVKCMLIALYQDYLMAQYQYEQEQQAAQAETMSDEEFYSK